MEKRKLGESSLEVYPIAYGAWGIGGPPFWNERDEGESVRAVRKALDCGINLIDTAPIYGFGRSEEIVGKAIEGRRDEVVLATKCGLRWKSESLKDMYKDLSPKSIWEELDASLKRLKTDYIDLYQIHWPSPDSPLVETMTALSLLKAQGKIREIGVSNFDEDLMRQALEIAPVTSLQPKYNMLEREIEGDLLPLCREKNVGMLAYSPLASGLLTGKYGAGSKFDGWRGKGNFGIFQKKTLGPALEKVQKLNDLAKSKGYSLNHLALRWVINQPGIICALAGANTAEQVEDNARAGEIEISDDIWGEVETILGG